MNAGSTEAATDGELWDLIRQGSVAAFEVLVRRYQGTVSAVAFSACGNLALSEDVAQETFWAAWREREATTPPARLLPWLCGVARNLARNAHRRAGRPAGSAAAPLDTVAEPMSATPAPDEVALSREEETLVWDNLAQIPATYREPLILFYRDGQSVAGVAQALDLTEDATKQRLSRGRALLRERMTDLVEAGLRRSRPGRRFTTTVVAGVVAGSAGAKTASAAAGVAGAGVVAQAGIGAGLAAGLGGSVVGLAGGWLGTWVPAQLAPTRRERDLILGVGRRMLVVSVLLLAALFGLIGIFAGTRSYIFAWLGWMATFQGYIWFEVIRLNRALRQARADGGPDAEPNPAPLLARANALARTRRGRVYQSRARLFGWPLIDCNVSDPVLPTGEVVRLDCRAGSRVARGWIAIGDHARGLLVAVGSTAIGPIALGIDWGIGLISFGGRAVGVVALGGIAVGGLAFGGLAVGGLGIGGLALGIWAAGGLAVAANVAVGGLALAYHAAFGGGAFAIDVALGGDGGARHFNDDLARSVLRNHPLKQGMDAFNRFRVWWLLALPILALQYLIIALKYRREPVRLAPGDVV